MSVYASRDNVVLSPRDLLPVMEEYTNSQGFFGRRKRRDELVCIVGALIKLRDANISNK